MLAVADEGVIAKGTAEGVVAKFAANGVGENIAAQFAAVLSPVMVRSPVARKPGSMMEPLAVPSLSQAVPVGVLENNGIDLAVVVGIAEGIERCAVRIDVFLNAIGAVVETEIGKVGGIEIGEALGNGDGGCCGAAVGQARDGEGEDASKGVVDAFGNGNGFGLSIGCGDGVNLAIVLFF